jgi:type VI secretion system secreted protein VgrG
LAFRTLSVWFQHKTLAVLHVLDFEERAQLGVPAEAEVEVVTTDYVALDELIGVGARVIYAYEGGSEQAFTGIVEAATAVGHHGVDLGNPRYRYRLRVVSELKLHSRMVTCQIFQEKDVKEIVSAVLEQLGIPADRVEWRLTASYPKRAYCVQYRESALAFISRLCEDEGIWFHSLHAADKPEKLVFGDDSTAAPAPPDGGQLVWRKTSELSTDTDQIVRISDRHAVRSGKFVLRDYNFEKPKLDLETTAESDVDTDLEMYDYPGGYADADQGKRLVKIRLEAEQVERRTLRGRSNATGLAVGHRITIAESEGLDGEYVITALHRRYTWRRGAFDEPEQSEDDLAGERYEVSLAFVPADIKYRRCQVTPKPLILGPQTATVVAPADSEDQTIHTDEHGRIKVEFHWDRSGLHDDTASAWFRTAQLQASGSLILPRVGWEVIVEFLEGDPDQPIITGRLYNGALMPPYALPEGKTRTALRTVSTPGGKGMNEIRFEDKAGAEEISITSHFNTTVKAANNKTKNVGNNESQAVKLNASLEVAAKQDTKITKGFQNTIGASQTVTVAGNRKVEVNAVQNCKVGGSSTTTVGGNQMEMDGNPLEGLLAVAAERAAEAAVAAANRAVGQVEAAVQGAIGQVMGPVDSLVGQAQALGQAMSGAANGDLSAAGALVAGASGLPGAGQVLGGLGAPPPAATQTAPGAEASAGATSAANMMRAAATSAIQRGMGAARDAVGSALGVGGEGGGGQSRANTGGPAGDVSGQDEANTAKGPGHGLYKVNGSHTETSAALRLMAALNGINTNVAVSMTQTVGAAYIELVLGNHAESTEAMKTENCVGLIVVTKGDETEQVGGAKTTMVGGAIVHLVKGTHVVEAGASATIIGAFHKIQAKTKVMFKAGDSNVVIDGGGITLKTSGMIMIGASKIQLTKNVNDA